MPASLQVRCGLLPHYLTENTSPGWQSGAWQIAVSVVNWKAFARLFFRTDRLTGG